VNDILTIRVLENTTASSGADTNATRKSSTSLAIPNFFGLESHTGSVPLANLVSANSDSAFAGEGATNRQGRLSALLSARVREVLPNGDLVIEGIKELKVNNERQTLTLFGVVRTRDIAPNNVVPSTAVAAVSGSDESLAILVLFERVIPGDAMRRLMMVLILAFLTVPAAAAVRVKEVARVQGVRDNQLVGYGLVVGLKW
jgi:hypothetical protein